LSESWARDEKKWGLSSEFWGLGLGSNIQHQHGFCCPGTMSEAAKTKTMLATATATTTATTTKTTLAVTFALGNAGDAGNVASAQK